MARSAEKYKEISIKEFTQAAAHYENNFAGVYDTCKKDYPEILEILKEKDFQDFLDAGCGPAPLIGLLSQEFPGRHYVGIDLTPAMIDRAKEKNIPNAEFLVGDCENLPFDDASFDVIVCCESFHHYPNPQDFFDSASRCLRPGGILFIRDFTAEGTKQKVLNKVMMPLCNVLRHGDVRVTSRQEYTDMCAKAGLTVTTFQPIEGTKVKVNVIATKN